MRLAVLLFAFAIVSVTAGFTNATAGLDELGICDAAAFARASGRCEPPAETAIRSNSLYCAVRSTGHAGDVFRGAFVYRGKRFPLQSARIASDGWIHIYVTIGAGRFPGGGWRCEVTAGRETASRAFTVRGPTTTVSSTAACLSTRTLVVAGVRVCRADTGRQLRRSSSITCSAVYSLAQGRRASVRVLHENRDTGISVTKTVPLPVSIFGVQITNRPSLPAGDYACEFSLDGRRLATRRFSIE